MYFFLFAAMTSCAFTWQGMVDLLPLGGSLILTFAAFQNNDSGCDCSPFRGTCSELPITSLRTPPILMETNFFMSILISLVRVQRQQKRLATKV
ncbi:YgjV family protein [Kluyvera sp. 142486]|uniref:YgjV family protein n=1 Tax=Kluyvera sp. 142486 TaxID=3390050 RepID=UPI0039800543